MVSVAIVLIAKEASCFEEHMHAHTKGKKCTSHAAACICPSWCDGVPWLVGGPGWWGAMAGGWYMGAMACFHGGTQLLAVRASMAECIYSPFIVHDVVRMNRIYINAHAELIMRLKDEETLLKYLAGISILLFA